MAEKTPTKTTEAKISAVAETKSVTERSLLDVVKELHGKGAEQRTSRLLYAAIKGKREGLQGEFPRQYRAPIRQLTPLPPPFRLIYPQSSTRSCSRTLMARARTRSLVSARCARERRCCIWSKRPQRL